MHAANIEIKSLTDCRQQQNEMVSRNERWNVLETISVGLRHITHSTGNAMQSVYEAAEVLLKQHVVGLRVQ